MNEQLPPPFSHPPVEIAVLSEENVTIPSYASSGASGADVRAFLEQEIVIPPGEVRLVPTGLRFCIPHGYEIQVRPRSGLALNSQISVLNTPGTIDADYRGEVKIILINFSQTPFVVSPGMRIAQLVVAPVVQAQFTPKAELVETTRGAGGFGHTGIC